MKYQRRGWSGKCGVYLITCKVNGKRYVGSSNNVCGRVSQHFGKQCLNRYAKSNTFYADIQLFGRDAFDVSLLEFCDRDSKILTEKKWYDAIKPEYNQIPPDDVPFKNPLVIEKAKESFKKAENIARHRTAHQSDRCRQKCRKIQEHRMIKCKAIDETGAYTFDCLTDAARWLKRNGKIPSIISHIKRAAANQGKAYGYRWEVMPNEDDCQL